MATNIEAFEPFVAVEQAADFLKLKPRRVLEMARSNLLPAHPIGKKRRTWRFLLSELAISLAANSSSRKNR